MELFQYKAITQAGDEISGEIEADSAQEAENKVGSMGYIPMSVTQAKVPGSDSSFLEKLTSVKSQELIIFTKQFRTMIKAGISILAVFQVLAEQTENRRLKNVISTMADDVRKGANLYQAFSGHKAVFPDLYRNLIKAGEISGSLPQVLERLIYILEHEYKIKKDIQSALQYPAFVVVLLGAAFFVLLIMVIPKFVNIFVSAGLELPLPTRICLVMYNLVHDYWVYMVLGGIGLVAGFFYALKRPYPRLLFDAFCMKIPIIGPLLVKSTMSRFASIFSILHASGIVILDAMKLLKGAINNAAVNREFEKISALLEEGRGISSPLKKARYFTPMVVNMVAIGEESGNLEEMLKEISIHYDAEVEHSMKTLSDAIGPILSVGLAAVVGFFALAIFLPMWDLTKMV